MWRSSWWCVLCCYCYLQQHHLLQAFYTFSFIFVGTRERFTLFADKFDFLIWQPKQLSLAQLHVSSKCEAWWQLGGGRKESFPYKLALQSPKAAFSSWAINNLRFRHWQESGKNICAVSFICSKIPHFSLMRISVLMSTSICYFQNSLKYMWIKNTNKRKGCII